MRIMLMRWLMSCEVFFFDVFVRGSMPIPRTTQMIFKVLGLL